MNRKIHICKVNVFTTVQLKKYEFGIDSGNGNDVVRHVAVNVLFLQALRNVTMPLPRDPFCPPQIRLGHIYYVHDSSESTEDNFTISASAYEIDRRSLPVTVVVTVRPVNDEPPKLTHNTGLEVMLRNVPLTVA